MTARVQEVFRQSGNFSEEEIRLLTGPRNPLVRAILRAKYVCTEEELVAFLAESMGWLPKPQRITPLKGDWQSKLLANEVKAWGARPKMTVPKSVQELFIAVLEQRGRERVELDQAYGFRYCLWPELDLTREFYKNAGWVAPCDWLYEVSKKGQIKLPGGERTDPFHLFAGVGMVDLHCKPSYQDGRQRFANDLAMEAIIEHLQEKGAFDTRTRKAPDEAVARSRFYLSRRDYENVVAPLLKEIFDIRDPATVRLERVAEWSVLCQYKTGSNWPRAQDGKTNSWVWFHEFFGSAGHSLGGGGYVGGGLSRVGLGGSGFRWGGECGRLLAVWDMPA